MIAGDRVGDRAHLCGERIDVEGDADDDDAVVIGAGEGRRHRDQRERRALERPREVHPPDRVERVRPGAGGDVRRPDLARRGAARVRLLGPAEFAAAAAIAASGQ